MESKKRGKMTSEDEENSQECEEDSKKEGTIEVSEEVPEKVYKGLRSQYWKENGFCRHTYTDGSFCNTPLRKDPNYCHIHKESYKEKMAIVKKEYRKKVKKIQKDAINQLETKVKIQDLIIKMLKKRIEEGQSKEDKDYIKKIDETEAKFGEDINGCLQELMKFDK